MNPPRERSAVLAAWLEEGPNELPDQTRRAIAVDIRTTHQSRRSIWFPWRLPPVDRLSLVALAAVAVMVLAVAGLAVSRIAPDGSNVGGDPSEAPSASPSLPPASASPSSPFPPGPTTVPIPEMTQTHVSSRYGYSIRYPADWSGEEASEPWSPPDWKAAGSPQAPFDFIASASSSQGFRAASAPLPEGLPNVSDWIDDYLTYSDVLSCKPPRETQELIQIDGAPGRLRDSCGEVEATVVLEGRVYMFTLFDGGYDANPATNVRALFDAFAATIALRPEDAAVPSLSP